MPIWTAVAQFLSSAPLSSDDADRKSFTSDTFQNYEDWRDQFAAGRLRLLYYLGLIANPVFIAADLLLHREHLHSLIIIRSALELGLLLCFVLFRRTSLLKPKTLVVLWVVIGNMCIAHMTAVLVASPRRTIVV